MAHRVERQRRQQKAKRRSPVADVGYTFTPVAMETLGPINSQRLEFLSDLGRRISQVSDDVRESAFLFQSLSVLIQRFNSVAVQGVPTLPHSRWRMSSSRSSTFFRFNVCF